MSKDQMMGVSILTVSVVVIVVYAWLLYTYALIVLQITAFVAVAGVLAITAWIGWTMATTPPPAPIEIPETTTEPAAPNQLANQPTKESN
jgi:predicted DNA-binding transcriptional regulator